LPSVSPEVVQTLSINYQQLGTLIGLFSLAGIFLSVPIGMALRWTTDRVLVSAGMFLLAAGAVLSALSDTFGGIGFGRLICGVGFVFSTVYFAKMVTDWFVGKELATALGLLVMSWPAGIALAQVVQPLIAQNYGWEAGFWLSATYCFVGCLIVALLYRPPGTQVNAGAKSSNRLSREHLILTLIASLAWAFFNAGYIVYLSFAQPMIQSHGYSVLQAGVIASVPSWIMVFASIGAGQIVDRTGRSDAVLYTGMFTATISLLLLTQADAVWPAVILFGLIGAAPAGVIMALTGEAMPAHARAFGMGIFFSSYFVLVTPAPAIAGWLFDLTNKPEAAIIFGASLFALAAASNGVFRWRQRVTRSIRGPEDD